MQRCAPIAGWIGVIDRRFWGNFALTAESWDLPDAAFLGERPRGDWQVPLHQK